MCEGLKDVGGAGVFGGGVCVTQWVAELPPAPPAAQKTQYPRAPDLFRARANWSSSNRGEEKRRGVRGRGEGRYWRQSVGRVSRGQAGERWRLGGAGRAQETPRGQDSGIRER